ncbi:MAG: TonB-dependent receptor, partial [Spirochaetaceae bacterium]|nr:TonB-dependent receptor [Spirochaetaceae bacterium]
MKKIRYRVYFLLLFGLFSLFTLPVLAQDASDYKGETAPDYDEETASNYDEEPASNYDEEIASNYDEEPASDYSEDAVSDYNEEPASDHNVETASDYNGELDDSFFDFGEDAGITMTGTQETTQQMETITRDQIQKQAAPDLATLLEEVLDIGVTRYGGYGNQTSINIRGFDTSRIAILIDGIPANSPRSGEFDINQIDLSNVERIEVIYGGSDTKFNVTGALGGVINIIMSKKQPAGLSFGGGVSNTSYIPGSYNERRSGGKLGKPHYEDLFDTQMLNFYMGYGWERFSMKLNWSGNRAGNHYLYKDNYNFARRKQSNEVLDTGLGMSLVRALPQDATLMSTTDFYLADRQYPVTATAVGFAKSRDFSVKETLMLDAPRAFHDKLSSEASLSYTMATMKYGFISRSEDHYITAINRWGWYPATNFTLRLGLDWRAIHVDSTEDGVRSGNNGGTYITGEFMPLKGLLVIGSLKGATDMRDTALVPKAGLVWKPVDWLTIKNNYFRSFKFPDFDDLYYRSSDELYLGNPDLRPEDGIGGDLGIDFRIGERFEASSTAYAQRTEDSIHWVKQGGRWRPENVGTALFIGVDLRPLLTIPFLLGPFEKLKLGATYQFQLSWLLNEGLTLDDSFRIPYMPTHIIGGSADLLWKTGSVMLSAHWESRRYADTRNEMPLEPYCLMTLTVNQNIGKHFSAFGAIRNMLNA